MKPVVSSLVALAIAIAPLTAMASSPTKSTHHGKAATAKIVKHKDEKSDKSDKPFKVVKHTKKPALHHASNVDVSGKGHGEPGPAIVAASLTVKTPAPAAKPKIEKTSAKVEMPKLPDPKAKNGAKPTGKDAKEKGARKPSEKKTDGGDSASKDGQPERDEVDAELVARIRAGVKAKKESAVPAPCMKDAVEVIRGPEIEKLQLMKCDGTLAPISVDQLSIMIRPGSAARPTTPIAELAKKKGSEIAPGIRRVDPRLVQRIQAVVDHFKGPGLTKMSIISGYRPTSVGSMHSTGRAVDFRIEGVKNEDVVAFCKTLDDTGCGYYPNSSFVHVDVRDANAGHVAWIDASGPGESPRYVAQWPEKAEDIPVTKPSEVLEHTSAKHHEETAAPPAEEAPATEEKKDTEETP